MLHSKQPCQEGIQDTIEEVFKWAEDFIAPSGFIAATKSISVADISVLATYSTLIHAGLISEDQFQGDKKPKMCLAFTSIRHYVLIFRNEGLV